MSGIMTGVRVLEVADFVFVPAAGAVLSDWGAEVIKVEHHEQGDQMRGHKMFHPNHKGELADFNALMEGANRGKRSIGLNLASAEGLEVLYALAKTCDVFLTSKLEPTRKKLKFDTEHITAQNPDIIYARGTGHGALGPEAATGGFDILDFWYRSGTAMGTKPLAFDSIPYMPGPGFGDLTGAMHLAGGVSAALFHREKTGEAKTVDVSLLGSGMWAMGGGISLSEMYGVSSSQAPVGKVVNALANVYRTSDDKWIALCCLQAFRYWPALCRVIGREEWLSDARFTTWQGLNDNADDLVKLLADEFSQRTYDQWLSVLGNFEGQWSPVQDALQVSDDPQAKANGYLTPTTSTTGQEFQVVQPPVQFDRTPATTRPAPLFNADGDDILTELGLSTEEILNLKLADAVA